MQIPAPVKPARISAFLAVGSLLLLIIGILAEYVLIYLSSRGMTSEMFFFVRDAFVITAQFIFLAFILTALFIPIWTYQICKNVRTISGGVKQPRKHLATWGWFIPALNFFVPFTSLRRCWSILQANFPVIGLAEKKPIPVMLWQIGFCGLLISSPITLTLLYIVLNQGFSFGFITPIIFLISFLLGSICGIISIFQLLRFEKLTYNQY